VSAPGVGRPVDDSYLRHLAEAIAFETVTFEEPAGGDESRAFDEFHTFLAATYPRTWQELAVETVEGHSLLLTWTGSNSDAGAIVLMAHQDVVPVEPETRAAWSKPPFAGERTATHLVGRGALDDKGSLIGILEAVEGLLIDGFRPARTVHLAFTHDEETTRGVGSAAMAKVLEERRVRALFVLDEGGFVTEGLVPMTRRPVALLGIAEKGYVDLELSATGTPGHSSQPPRHTAVGLVARAIARLEDAPMPARLELVRALLGASSKAASPAGRTALRILPRLGPVSRGVLSRRQTTNASIRTTTAATIVEGGVKANVLPSTARAIVNFRLIPGDTVEAVLKHVRRVVGRDVDLRVVRAVEASPVSDPESEGYRLVAGTVVETFPDAVVAPWVVIGATDGRYFAGVSDTVLRFTPFRANPDEVNGFHGVDERIRLEDADDVVRFYRRLIEQAVGPR
jgi:carboxypeptidase PM20D1